MGTNPQSRTQSETTRGGGGGEGRARLRSLNLNFRLCRKQRQPHPIPDISLPPALSPPTSPSLGVYVDYQDASEMPSATSGLLKVKDLSATPSPHSQLPLGL